LKEFIIQSSPLVDVNGSSLTAILSACEAKEQILISAATPLYTSELK
jgi:hypothetical protein